MNDLKLLTVKDVARILSVSDRTVYTWVRQGRIPVTRFGHHIRFHPSHLAMLATDYVRPSEREGYVPKPANHFHGRAKAPKAPPAEQGELPLSDD
jgi:excisionase family DNA binding protein